jgi:signal transduction histidine kinase
MSVNPTVEELSSRVLTYLCRALQAQVGVQYALEPLTGMLRLTATYATAAGAAVPARLKLGDSLIGQAALDKQLIVVDEVPEDSLRVRWGFGEALPRSLVILPLVHEGEVQGVIELGSLGRFSQLKLDFLERAAVSVALALTAAEARARIDQLLEEAQTQAQELAAQQEELRQVNERLEEQARALVSQKDSLLATETVLRQKAAELERASRYKSEFLANMSHELRTPLNSSLLLAKLLSDNKQGNLTAEQVKYAQSISSAGNDLLTLINDILDLSKIEAGKVELVIEQVPLARIINQLKHRFEPLIAEKKLWFDVSVEPGCPEVLETDAQRLQQVLTNLLSNAAKFVPAGQGRVTVTLASDARAARIEVQDNGPGVPFEQQQLVFEKFRQGGDASNRPQGTGLGLPISRQIVEHFGGRMWLRSAPGQGACFGFELPWQGTQEEETTS